MEFPRRSRLDLMVPAEKAIHDAMQEVEKAGADTRLTNAVVKLAEAKDWVADYIDGVQRDNDFKTRLLNEKGQLDGNIQKLQAFMNSDKFALIDTVQQRLLNTQLPIMKAYSQVLLERITALPIPEPAN